MARRSRKTTSQTIALWVLKVDAAATFIVLGLCGLSIVRSFEGALPYLTTLILTAASSVMALRGAISPDFMTVYAVVIAFYFGTQSQKQQDALDGEQK